MFAYRSILREQARPAVVRESRRAPWLAVSVVCFGAFMGQLDASIVTITFPAMEHDFGVTVAAVQWVSLAYLLGLVAMLAPAGRLGDAAGRKLVYTYGFAVFFGGLRGLRPGPLARRPGGAAPAPGRRGGDAAGQQRGSGDHERAEGQDALCPGRPGGGPVHRAGPRAHARRPAHRDGRLARGVLGERPGRRASRSSRAGTCCRVPGSSAAGTVRRPGHGAAGDLDHRAAPGTLRGVRAEPAAPGWPGCSPSSAWPALVAFVRRETRTVHPADTGLAAPVRIVALGLAGAGCGYLALFGPLVLIPQVLSRDAGSAARTGLVLSALPLGFGLAALLGDLVLPRGWGDRRRGLAGALLAGFAMAAAMVIPLNPATVVPQLALAGRGAGHVRAREQCGDHAQRRRPVRLTGRRPGQHGPGDRHHARHLADGTGLASRQPELSGRAIPGTLGRNRHGPRSACLPPPSRRRP